MEFDVEINEEQTEQQEVIQETEVPAEQAEEEVTEQVEAPAQKAEEKPAKTYTQEELNRIVASRNARTEAKLRREYDRKYGDLEAVLKAGTGKESVEDITGTLRTFYESKGVKIQPKAAYSRQDEERLGRADADDIINTGDEDVLEELEQLARIGKDKMTDREKARFQALAAHRQTTERAQELEKLGVSEDVYNSSEFRAFAGQFNPNTPIRKVYDIYRMTRPKTEKRTMGSMKSQPEQKVKDYYTPAEIEKMTMKDLDDPKVWEAVRRSMTGRA